MNTCVNCSARFAYRVGKGNLYRVCRSCSDDAAARLERVCTAPGHKGKRSVPLELYKRDNRGRLNTRCSTCRGTKPEPKPERILELRRLDAHRIAIRLLAGKPWE